MCHNSQSNTSQHRSLLFQLRVHAVQLALILVCTSLIRSNVAMGYSNLVVIGDSLSDVGNDHDNSFGFAVADPYWEGRFSNGPVYVEYLSTLMGLDPSVHSEAGGLNHAHGGAQVRIEPAGTAFFIDSLETQKQKYLTANSGVADPDALYVVFGGANDARDVSVDLTEASSDLASIISDLVGAGAANIVVPNIPDLGLTPDVTEFNGGAGSASTDRSNWYNQSVDAELSVLSEEHPSLNIIRFDVFGLVNEIVAGVNSTGSFHGFTNFTDDCWEGGPTTATSGMGLGDGFFTTYPVCSVPDEYLFWDIIHPTTAAHEFFAGRLHEQLTVIDADFDDNGQLDCADIDALTARIAASNNGSIFDLTGDGIVDLADQDEWLALAGAENLPSGNSYLPGDANLDGHVDGHDFLVWNQAKDTNTSAWCSADFNADGTTNGDDFEIWSANKFTSSAESATVPEPTQPLVLTCMLVSIFYRSSRFNR